MIRSDANRPNPNDISNVRRTEGEPHDRLTMLCQAGIDAIRVHLDEEGCRVIVVVIDGDENGTGFEGYDDLADAVRDMWQHAAAVQRTLDEEVLP